MVNSQTVQFPSRFHIFFRLRKFYNFCSSNQSCKQQKSAKPLGFSRFFSTKQLSRFFYKQIWFVQSFWHWISLRITCACGTWRVQGNSHTRQCDLAEKPAGQRALAILRLPMLLLHLGMLNVACHLPIQESKQRTFSFLPILKIDTNVFFRLVINWKNCSIGKIPICIISWVCIGNWQGNAVIPHSWWNT